MKGDKGAPKSGKQTLPIRPKLNPAQRLADRKQTRKVGAGSRPVEDDYDVLRDYPSGVRNLRGDMRA